MVKPPGPLVGVRETRKNHPGKKARNTGAMETRQAPLELDGPYREPPSKERQQGLSTDSASWLDFNLSKTGAQSSRRHDSIVAPAADCTALPRATATASCWNNHFQI